MAAFSGVKEAGSVEEARVTARLLTTSRERSVYFLPDVARTSRPSALVNACISGVTFTAAVPIAMSRADAFGPYARSFLDLSGLKLPPDRLIPAKSPFEREYEYISAVS